MCKYDGTSLEYVICMKMTKIIKTIVLIISIVFLADFAYAESVRISWDSNSESDLEGYVVYYGTVSHSYTQSIDVGLTTDVDITDLSAETAYFFAVTAYDTSGNESDYSEEVSVYIPGEDDTSIPDTDNDGIPDHVEESLGLDPTDPSDSLLDEDGDGIVNLVEYMAGTSPVDASDRPETDDVLKDVIGEAGEEIDLSDITSRGLYTLVPLTDTCPEVVDDVVSTTTPGAFLYNVVDDDSTLVYRLRISLTEQLSVLGEYEPGTSMSLEDPSSGIQIEFSEDALVRSVPIGIGNADEESVSAVDYDNETLEFDVVPFGLVLSNPAVITVAYDGENPVVQHYDTTDETWEDVDNVQSADGVVSFSTQELGTFKIYSEGEEDDNSSDAVTVSDGGSGGGGGCFITAAGF